MKTIEELQEYIIEVSHRSGLTKFTKDLLGKYDRAINSYLLKEDAFDSELTLMRAIVYELSNTLEIFDTTNNDKHSLEQVYTKAYTLYQFYEQGHWIPTDDIVPCYNREKELVLVRLNDGTVLKHSEIVMATYDNYQVTHFMRIPILKVPEDEKEVQN